MKEKEENIVNGSEITEIYEINPASPSQENLGQDVRVAEGKNKPTNKEKKAEGIQQKEELSGEKDKSLINYGQENNKVLLEIKNLIEDRLQYDRVKENAFDKLYEDMRQYKERDDFLFNYQKPIINDIILLYDSMIKVLESLNSESIENDQIKIKENINYLVEELLEILYRRDITLIEEESTIFNPKTQKAIKVIPTNKKEQDKLVEKIVRKGFISNEKIIRSEEVTIKKFMKQKEI